MSEYTKPFLPTHLHRVNKQNFQQGKVQLVEHVQDAASHQHSNNIWMKKGWRDLGEVEKLLEEIGQREKEPRIKLLLVEIMALSDCFLEVKGSLSIKRMECCPGHGSEPKTPVWIGDQLGAPTEGARLPRPTISTGGSNTAPTPLSTC